MTNMITLPVEIRHMHFFAGLGGGAKGFNKGHARVGTLEARFRCIGGIDVDAAAVRDFEKLTGTRGTVMDLFDRDQYKAFHGVEPPRGWREVTIDDIRRAAGGERPHIVFLSAPCKGFSGLLSETRSKTAKYQALNRLTLRGVWLMLEAWADDPPELIVFENVPRIATRGRHLLDQIVALLRQYGYATAETTHDCGEIGGLAQSRKRFLLVARHAEKVPPFLYEPTKKSLRAVSDVLERMPLPGDPAGGPMHRVPQLQWKTWVRLAFVEAGSDWRSLQKLRVADGVLTDFTIVPERAYHNGYCGVRRWDEPSGTVAGSSRPLNGSFSIADPRYSGKEYSQYGVLPWDGPMGAVSAQSMPGGGKYAVADPRHAGPAKHSNEYRIVPWGDVANAVTSAHGTGQCVADPRTGKTSHSGFGVTPWAAPAGTVAGESLPSNGSMSVADPRPARDGFGKYSVTPFDAPSKTVIGGSTTGQSAFAVADPRPNMARERGDNYLTAGHYGVADWRAPSGAVSAAAAHDNGRWSVADPRDLQSCANSQTGASATLPGARDHLVARITALDGTWHRPFTTLELAALQSLIDPEEYLQLDGLSDQDWRERIGNAVPSDAAQEIANVMGTTLLLAWSGETFILSSQPIWVQPVAIALSLAQGDAS
jgi:site-specific DNA-cytosine methylase